MRVALYQPEIAGNVGAVMRLGACLGVGVDLSEARGIAWDDRRVRRTAMDYIDYVEVIRHHGFRAFRESAGDARLILFTTKASISPSDFAFSGDDILLFGQESAGVPQEVREACPESVRLPIRAEVRSLNLASAVAIGLGEALRQTGRLPS